MAKQRYVNTKFWDDRYIFNLKPIEKLLFLYFLTNPLTNISGIYEIQIKRIIFDTGMRQNIIFKILECFKRDKRIYYFDGWIVIKNFIKHQSLNEKVKIGITKEFKNAPPEVWKEIMQREHLRIGYDSLLKAYGITYDSLSHTNTNTNININSNTNTNAKADSLSVDKINNKQTNDKTNERTKNEMTTLQVARITQLIEKINDKKNILTWCRVSKQIGFDKTIEALTNALNSKTARSKGACAMGMAKLAGYSYEKDKNL